MDEEKILLICVILFVIFAIVISWSTEPLYYVH